MKIIISISVALLFMLLITISLRRGALKLSFTILWLVLALGILILASWQNLLGLLASTLGIATPSNLLFFFSIVILSLILLLITYEISKMYWQINNLAQTISLISHDLNNISKNIKSKKEEF